jgi:hypothetical protein
LNDLFAVVKSYLLEDGWPIVHEIPGEVLQTAFRSTEAEWDAQDGPGGFPRTGSPAARMPVPTGSLREQHWTCYAQVRPEHNQVLFYSVVPFAVPPGRRLPAAEYITRANFGMAMGNFEMDFENGAVRFKTGIDVTGDELTPALLSPLLYANVLMMSTYLEGLLDVAEGDVAPMDAIAAAHSQAT